jgi:SH3-like domain-containing protein
MLRLKGTSLAMAMISALALGACGDHASEGKDCPEAQRAKTVSGFCVPRWVSLKRGEVYGRKGPGKDYPAVWVYRVQGLPVQIVAETEDWRKICDPLGGSTWVHRSMVDGRRTIMSQAATPAPLLREPKAGAPVEGLLNAKALAAIDKCKDGWCKVSAGGVSGWLATDKVWGLAPAPQCR